MRVFCGSTEGLQRDYCMTFFPGIRGRGRREGDLARIDSWGSRGWGEFLPSRLIDDDASSAHHTELGVWLQLISMLYRKGVGHVRI